MFKKAFSANENLL